jgi:propionate catabolism operon transcriptional regulator
VQLYAPHSASVFIHGETGTGKELVAQALHAASERSDKPFVAVNCAALPDSLLESELFGYEEGAFTGARRGGKTGLFELAHTGTLFLDEVGDIGPGAQLRLLRVLETRELMRVGGSHIIPVDIRVISASHRSLTELAHSGRFRQDLCYRLAVLRIQIPPLRRRLMDIPLLLGELLQKYNNMPQYLSLRMLKAMEAYHWPGNIRELKSFMESYLILLDKEMADEALFLQLLEEWARESEYHREAPEQAFPVPEVGGSLKHQLTAARREIALSTVKQCAWNKNLAAKRLGISYNTLWRILSEGTTGHDMA